MNLRLAAIGSGLAILIAGVALLVLGGGSSGYQIKVNLPDADGLLAGSRVEIGGIGVGSVKSLRITPQDHALVTIGLDKADAPVGTNASVVIRPADLLGEKFLDLSVGNRNDPAQSGFTIPADHTQDATDFDQAIDVLAPTVRDRLAVMIHETGVALFGRGTDLQAVLKALPPSVTDATDLIDQVTASNSQLEGLITHAGQVLASLTADHQAVGKFVGTAGAALSATAAHERGLAQTVSEAPSLLSQLRSTLQQLDVAGAGLRPAATGLIKTAPALTETLKELPGFTTAALPTLKEAQQIAPTLTKLGKQAAPVIANLEPTTKLLQTVATDSDPVTLSLQSSTDDLLGMMQNWARAIQFHDGASHEFRVSTEVTPDIIKALLPLIQGAGSSASKKTKSTSGKRQSAAPTSTTPAAATTTPTTAPRSHPPVTAPSGHLPTITLPSVTTVTKPLTNLLNYLLGK
jgi:phospholipid/cholesterol/gamma-HCH transport system substrate-binding protein